MKRKLILSLLAMLLPISAWCADGDTFDYTPDGSNTKFYFRVISEDSKTVELYNNNHAAVQSVTGFTLESSITIPETAVNGSTNYSVTRIGECAFYLSSGLTSVSLPSTITSIGYMAFARCALTSITLPDGLLTIGDQAFSYCPLTSIVIPASVTSIGVQAFANNDNLTNISVDAGNPKYNSAGDCNAIIDTSTGVLVAGCKNTVIPNTVTDIEGGAFQGAGISGNFTVPNTVASIGALAFQKNNITSLEIPVSVGEIGYGAFSDCYISISVASGNTKYESTGNCLIEKSSKELISAGKTVTSIPTGVQTIGSYSFFNNSITSIEIPSTVISIGDHAFDSCKNLASITLNENLSQIGNYTFSDCSGLHTLIIPATVKSIGSYAFAKTGWISNTDKSFALNIPYTLKISPSSMVFSSPRYATVIPYVKPAKTYTSFACAQDVDFSGATGLKAYVASGFDASAKKVSLKEVTSARAGEGIIIKAVPDTKYDLALATASDNGTNLLKGVTVDTAIEPIDGSNTNFLLSDGQFKKAQAGTLANGKAYLQLPTSAAARAKSLGITTEGDVTGIININLDEEGDGMIYDLNGRRISETATKGIYVKNGKKVIIK